MLVMAASARAQTIAARLPDFLPWLMLCGLRAAWMSADEVTASSAAMPGLPVQMYQHAMIADGMDALDVGTGSGYGTALLSTRLGDGHVTSIDLDDYLVRIAADRLPSIDQDPVLNACDAGDRYPAKQRVSTASSPQWRFARPHELTDGAAARWAAGEHHHGTLVFRRGRWTAVISAD